MADSANEFNFSEQLLVGVPDKLKFNPPRGSAVSGVGKRG